MRPLRATFLAACLLALPAAVSAQSMRDMPATPALSPDASVMQAVGVAQFDLTYSSPGVRDREIWGELVPYGEVWRAGANAPTRLTASHDFTFGGTDVPAGTYTLLVMPEDGAWQVMLNTDSSGRGAYGYNADENVAVVDVTPEEGPDRERLLYLFTDTTTDSTILSLEWAGLRAPIELGVDTEGIVSADIEATLGDLWRPHYNAARYLLDTGGDMEQAEAWMSQSLAVSENWWNHWFMARILAEQGNYAGAREHVARAQELGEGDDTWTRFFAPQADEALSSWPES